MAKRYLNYFIMGCFCLLVSPLAGLADSADLNWKNWLQKQVQQHPDVLAAGKSMDAALALAEGNQRPLYNPELETEYERNGDDDVYSVGISQTIDLWDKRGVRTNQANSMRVVAQMGYNLAVQEKFAEAMRAIVEYQSSKELVGFAEKQEAQMNTLLGLVEKRLQAGDMGQVDMELAFLGLSQRLNATAQARATLRQLESRLGELLPDWSESKIQIPVSFWEIKGVNLTSQELERLPLVAGARAEYEVVEHQARLAKLASKVEPTIGISAGEDGEEDVVALSLSVPLNFRNNYQAEATASTLESVSAKLRYRALKRQAHFAGKASLNAFDEYRRYYKRWQTLIRGRGETSDKLLAQQWDSGDLSTTEYLLALGQITEGMVAGIELRTQFHLACVDWLFISGQLGVSAEDVK